MIRFVIIMTALVLTGCASIIGKHQRVKVVSEPEGAEIFHEDKSLGFTPKYISLRRRANSSITLKSPQGNTLQYPLLSNYRWVDSGATNLIWMSFLTPVGWAADLITQAAWRYEPLGPLTAPAGSYRKTQRPKVIVIAPPLVDHEVLSDELGDFVETKVRKHFHTDRVLSFRSTLATFERYDYSYNSVSPQEYRDDLYEDLQADYITETEVIRIDNKFKVSITVKDLFRDTVLFSYNEVLPTNTFAYERRGALSRTFGRMSSLIPNTVGLDFSTSKPQIQVASSIPERPYESQKLRDNSALQYLSSLSLRTLHGNAYVARFNFIFDWSTVVSISYQNIRFEGGPQPNPLEDITYTWWGTQFGIGPQVGLASPVGYFYLELVPIFTTSFISWRSLDHDYQVNKAFIGFRSEFGYSIFVSRNINLRLVSAASSADEEQWSAVIRRTTGQEASVKGPLVLSSGLSVVYFFPEGRAALRSLF